MPFTFWRNAAYVAPADDANRSCSALCSKVDGKASKPTMAPRLPGLSKRSNLLTGDPATPENIAVNMVVVRGPHWRHKNEDGGAGRPGIVLELEATTKLATVFWYQTGVVGSWYRVGFGKQDLALAFSMPGVPAAFDAMARQSTSSTGSTGSRHSVAAWPLAECHGSGAPRRGFSAAVAAMLRPFRGSPKSVSSEEKLRQAGQEVDEPRPDCTFRRTGSKDSQINFADCDQTAIIFDWDDTLFPTTYAFYADRGLQLKMEPMSSQEHLNSQERADASKTLTRCSNRAATLLKLAAQHGRVIVVTLASRDWIAGSIEHFYPAVGKVLKEFDVPIVYAKELTENCDEIAPEGMRKASIFWSAVKGRAITEELNKFYSQYDGQSWKNIVSIGDSQFERLGTLIATAEYRKDRGRFADDDLSVCVRTSDQSLVCVRTKTFKMIEEPVVRELETQHTLLSECLPLLVTADGSVDLCVSDVDDWDQISKLLEQLRARQPVPEPPLRVASLGSSGACSSGSSNSSDTG
eukprot:TRINITY_DN21338_c0_g1_i1.p1 TRINITY_DN21338_c0_g1~~TRINITY_DN21338_c0_g1_i1.p1  ORF type:complete len:521 (-),score=104.93 TRINITY_DN21338_c0_g1_i1:131-1693(-)